MSGYSALLATVRALQLTVPVYVLTPIWTGIEANENGGTFDHSRLPVADPPIVQQRMATDSNLHLIDGLALVPNQLRYFVDGVHPNDVGFEMYASIWLQSCGGRPRPLRTGGAFRTCPL